VAGFMFLSDTLIDSTANPAGGGSGELKDF
jgi:hypothetical protein